MIDNMDSFRRIVCRNQDVRKIRLVCDAHGIFLAQFLSFSISSI